MTHEKLESSRQIILRVTVTFVYECKWLYLSIDTFIEDSLLKVAKQIK